MTPPLRNEFDRAATCEKYKARLIQLHGSEAAIEQSYRQWCIARPAVHHYTTYNAIARIEALADYLPSERHLISFLHEYEVK